MFAATSWRALVVGSVVSLTAACSAGVSDAGGAVFEQTLARIDGPFGGYLEFVDRTALEGAPQAWTALASGSLPGELATVLGVDPDAAEALLVAGQPSQRVTLVVGGQDEARIRSSATAAGWTGEEELQTDLTPALPLSISAATVRPLGEDVAFGGPAAPLARVDGPDPGLAEDPAVQQIGGCLGDVAVAVVAGGELGPLRAVGLRRVPGDEAAATSTLCVTGTTAAQVTEAVETTSPRGADRPWVDYLREPQVEELDGGVVRLVAGNAPGTSIGMLLEALQTRDLPGVPR
ncbi:hypothetical protein [Pseudonocardia sp. DLS-67]